MLSFPNNRTKNPSGFVGIHNRNGKAPTYINMKVVEKQKKHRQPLSGRGKAAACAHRKKRDFGTPGF